MMAELATLAGTVFAAVADATVALGVPASRTTPDGTVVDDGGLDGGAGAGDTVGNGVEMAQQFLFAIPDEVKTGLMLVLAAAIGIYLYLNFMRDQP
jgi:hypothetical protein